MIFRKPQFWDKKYSLLSFILYPLSLITQIIIFVKRIITKEIQFDIPVVCIGNIYIGGTGKTPISIFLAKEITKLGKKPVILRKYYKTHLDEHKLIRENFKNLILDNCRIEGIKKAKKLNFDSIILDDGFQDYKIKKNLSIICFNQKQLLGNGHVLPAGPLREKLISLKKANIIMIIGRKDKEFENKILKINKNLKIFYSYYKPKNLNYFKNKKLLALAGIGNPENFFNLLKENHLKVCEKIAFPDHYKFTKNEILKLQQRAKRKNYHIIMTEKDYFKIKDFKINGLNCLKVSLEIIKKDKLLQEIIKIYD